MSSNLGVGLLPRDVIWDKILNYLSQKDARNFGLTSKWAQALFREKFMSVKADYLLGLEPEHYDGLGKMTGVKKLDLRHAIVRNDAVAKVAQPMLREFKANSHLITNAEPLANLDTLQLDKARLEPDAMVDIAKKNPNLTSLSAMNVKLSVVSMLAIGTLTRLRELNLNDAPHTDEDIITLTGLSQLEVLRLNGPRFKKSTITNRGLQAITTFTNLKVLEIEGSQVTNVGVDVALQSLTNLQVLNINKTSVDEDVVDVLVWYVTRLKKLELAYTNVTDEPACTLVNTLTHLTDLNLDGNELTAVTVDAIARSQTNLVMLRLCNNDAIQPSSLKNLSTLTKLEDLYLYGLDLESEDEDELETLLPNPMIWT